MNLYPPGALIGGRLEVVSRPLLGGMAYGAKIQMQRTILFSDNITDNLFVQ